MLPRFAGFRVRVGGPGTNETYVEVSPHEATVTASVLNVRSGPNMRVGCLDGGVVREVANVASGTRAPIIQRVGDRLVVAGSDANPIRVATFTNPCH